MKSKTGASNGSKRPPQKNIVKPLPPSEPPLNPPKRHFRPIPTIPPIPEEEEEIFHQEEEEKEVKVEISKEEDNSWLDHLPAVVKLDEELHLQLSKERKEIRYKKVLGYCHEEVNSIFEYTFEFLENKRRKEIGFKKKSRKNRILRAKFRNGFYSPNAPKTFVFSEKLSTKVLPTHTLDSKNYLNFKSDDYLSDLSNIFGVNISDKSLEDPNPLFNDYIQKFHNASKAFMEEYKPYDLLKFPFIVCIGGPNGGGRTTIGQLLQKSFDAHFVEVKPSGMSDTKKGKKLTSSQPLEEVIDYPLKDSIQIKYDSEKTVVNDIVQTILSNMDGRGFVIIGYPNNKGQFSSLEKELIKNRISMQDYQVIKTEEEQTVTEPQEEPQEIPEEPIQSPKSARSRKSRQSRMSNKSRLSSKSRMSKSPRASARATKLPKFTGPSINGVIIALNNEPNRERLIDPETGNVYNPSFLMPGIQDLVGVTPSIFINKRKEIESRLLPVTVPEIQIIPPKGMQVYGQFESVAKKNASVTTIKHCDDIIQLIQQIDQFIQSLYKKIPELVPKTPLFDLIRPLYLIFPEISFKAVSAWYRCLDDFGRIIANQINLLNKLDGKLDVLVKTGLERYQLLISYNDDRLKLCKDFMQNIQSKNMSSHFRKIWDLSLKIRNENLVHVDDIVSKSGLVDLVLQLKRAPKLFFIALVQKMLYVKWVVETFHFNEEVDNETDTNSTFFTDLTTGEVDVPSFSLDMPSNLQFGENKITSYNSNPKIQPINAEIPHLDLQFAYSSENLPESAKANAPPFSGKTSKQISQAIPLTERINAKEKNERRLMASIRGIDYLLENLTYLDDVAPIEDEIYFNASKAFSSLNIMEFNPKSSFDGNLSMYAEEFFKHIKENTKDQMIINEAQTSLNVFNRFMKICKTKEAHLVNSVFDLRDSIVAYCNTKCTYEMEYFAREYRSLKQNKGKLNEELFLFDINHLNQDVKNLGIMSLSFNQPIIAQDLIKGETVIEMAKEACQRNLTHSNMIELLNMVSELPDIDQTEKDHLEYCMRIMECTEHFNVLPFLLSLAHDRDSEMEITEMFRELNKVPEESIIEEEEEEEANETINNNDSSIIQEENPPEPEPEPEPVINIEIKTPKSSKSSKPSTPKRRK